MESFQIIVNVNDARVEGRLHGIKNNSRCNDRSGLYVVENCSL